VEVVQTHISVVFLAGTYAHKLKKPVDLGFLDYTTQEKRLECCRQEVPLNRRLALRVFTEAYFSQADDREARHLLPFCIAYRHMV
jgi:aminoglycoside phosphotransferase family enzyme